MSDVRPAPFRAARGSIVALVGLALAVAAHGTAAGDVVRGPAPVVASLAVLAGCLVAAGQAWTARRLVLALLAVQVAVHGSLWLTSAGSELDPRLSGLATGAVVHQHGAGASLTPGMIAAHLAAVLVSAVLLAGVDAAVLVLWRLGRAVLGVRPSAVPVPLSPVVQPSSSLASFARARALLVSPRRGPPGLIAPC